MERQCLFIAFFLAWLLAIREKWTIEIAMDWITVAVICDSAPHAKTSAINPHIETTDLERKVSLAVPNRATKRE
jgi:hypothetical protein